MARRQVTRTKKTANNHIAALCNPGATWSPRTKRDAVRDIDSGAHRYYVIVAGQEVDIHTFSDSDGDRHLRTDPDKTKRNNLLELPDC